MTDHIAELAEKAGLHAEWFIDNPEIEKFAELIVKECIMLVNIWSDEVPCSEGYDIIPVNKLKEHFGVKND